jgi:hypothetical protein
VNQPVSTSAASPCTNVCRIDKRSGYCEGCRRTVDEIMAWPNASEDVKRAVLDALPRRRVKKSILPS